MYKYKYIALYLGLLLTLITGCEKIAGDGNLPEDLEDALENTGVSVEVTEIHSLDLIEGENAKVTIYSKILDYKGGNNIEKVELYLYSFNLKNGVESQTLKEDPVILLDLPLDSLEVFEDMQFEAALNVVNNTTREFKAKYLGNAWSELGVEERISSIPIMFDIKGNPTENAVTVSYEISSGLGCDDGPLKIGPEKENVSYFDEEDDSEFIFVVTDNTEGVCDSKPKQVQFLVEKL